MTKGLLTKTANYDEPGSWGRMSAGWPEFDDADESLRSAVIRTGAVPYGGYVTVGAKLRIHPDYAHTFRCALLEAGEATTQADNAVGAQAQEQAPTATRTPGGSVTLGAPAPAPVLTVMNDGVKLVSVHRDGTVQYHTDDPPEVAARAFWDAVSMVFSARTIPDGWTVTKERNPPGRHPAMRLTASDGRSELFGRFKSETLVRDFLAALIGDVR